VQNIQQLGGAPLRLPPAEGQWYLLFGISENFVFEVFGRRDQRVLAGRPEEVPPPQAVAELSASAPLEDPELRLESLLELEPLLSARSLGPGAAIRLTSTSAVGAARPPGGIHLFPAEWAGRVAGGLPRRLLRIECHANTGTRPEGSEGLWSPPPCPVSTSWTAPSPWHCRAPPLAPPCGRQEPKVHLTVAVLCPPSPAPARRAGWGTGRKPRARTGASGRAGWTTATRPACCCVAFFRSANHGFKISSGTFYTRSAHSTHVQISENLCK
jgi:hypothetical protein